jgi:hypothetical protein
MNYKDILIGCLLACVVALLYRGCTNKDVPIQMYDQKIDSLQSHINSLKKDFRYIQDSLNYKIDSITQVKQQVIKDYEIIYKDFNDATIVDDDSITRYISKKIYNR